MRVAGGWVRDKVNYEFMQVMGLESHDIDIALDDTNGEKFVLSLKSYAEENGVKMSGFGVTKLNPQLSKHLETATVKFLGYDLDFVNLRSETYN